eukprot:SM000085S23248  [mRNA]  locus=s85:269314:271355:- [translate_table: standard]
MLSGMLAMAGMPCSGMLAVAGMPAMAGLAWQPLWRCGAQPDRLISRRSNTPSALPRVRLLDSSPYTRSRFHWWRTGVPSVREEAIGRRRRRRTPEEERDDSATSCRQPSKDEELATAPRHDASRLRLLTRQQGPPSSDNERIPVSVSGEAPRVQRGAESAEMREEAAQEEGSSQDGAKSRGLLSGWRGEAAWLEGGSRRAQRGAKSAEMCEEAAQEEGGSQAPRAQKCAASRGLLPTRSREVPRAERRREQRLGARRRKRFLSSFASGVWRMPESSMAPLVSRTWAPSLSTCCQVARKTKSTPQHGDSAASNRSSIYTAGRLLVVQLCADAQGETTVTVDVQEYEDGQGGEQTGQSPLLYNSEKMPKMVNSRESREETSPRRGRSHLQGDGGAEASAENSAVPSRELSHHRWRDDLQVWHSAEESEGERSKLERASANPCNSQKHYFDLVLV